MNDFLITLCFGWAGVHRFRQKKYGLGALYLCTLGLFGIGWGIDSVIAFVRMVRDKEPNSFSRKDKSLINNLKENIPKNGSSIFTKLQIEAMTKANIIELAAGLGYTMTTTENSTKDKIMAEFMTQQEKQAGIIGEFSHKKWLIKTFNTEIVGTFAKCALDKSYERSEIICLLKPNSSLYLDYWEYKGEPAYYVCHQGMDAGCVPATLAKTLHDVYSDCEFEVTLRGESIYNDHDDLIQKIRIDVYK